MKNLKCDKTKNGNFSSNFRCAIKKYVTNETKTLTF